MKRRYCLRLLSGVTGLVVDTPSILRAQQDVKSLQNTSTKREDVRGCDILAKLLEPDPIFDALDPKVYQKTYPHYETRHGKRKRYTRPAIEIGLRVLDLNTCTTDAISVIKKGSIIESPPGWHVQIDVRSNGILWNGYNSQFDVEEPANTVVIGNKVPDAVKVRGVWKKTKNFVYVPYTRATHTKEIVVAGDTYLKNLVKRAFERLRSNRVYSRAVPGVLVADLFPEKEFYILALDEHMDYGEFSINETWQQWSAERVLVILGLNRERTNVYNCNSSKACGMFQFIPSTYKLIRNKYPGARLIPDFTAGAQDHLNIAQMAVLHHDNVLGELTSKYGKHILGNPHLLKVLGMRYNAGPRYTSTATNHALIKNDPDWANKLTHRRARQPREYLKKYDFLRMFVPNGAPLPLEEE